MLPTEPFSPGHVAPKLPAIPTKPTPFALTVVKVGAQRLFKSLAYAVPLTALALLFGCVSYFIGLHIGMDLMGARPPVGGDHACALCIGIIPTALLSFGVYAFGAAVLSDAREQHRQQVLRDLP